MNSIITYLILYIQYLHKQIFDLSLFIAKYIPLKQRVFDDSNSPKYQKLIIDKLPIIIKFEKQDFRFLLAYYKHKYGKELKPVRRRNGRSIPEDIICPRCNDSFVIAIPAAMLYLFNFNNCFNNLFGFKYIYYITFFYIYL